MIDLSTMNEGQREAVLTTEGPLLVLAGAGSGKTRVLTHRVAHLVLDRGVLPENVLAITFTNKATREMVHRIQHLLGPQSALVNIGTFHRTCLNLLRTFGERVGLPPKFGVIGPDDSEKIFKRLCKDHLNHDHNVVRSRVSKAKNDLVSPDQMERLNRWYATAAEIYRLYDKELESSGSIDLDDILVKCHELLQDCPDVLETCQDRFRYIHVDEYQDTNKVQYEIVSMLARKHRNLMVVGDDDQAIYGFRGADVSNIMNFEREYKDAKVIYLSVNYRSTPEILRFASAIIRRNKERKDKDITTPNTSGKPVCFGMMADNVAESTFVINTIKKQIASKVDPESIAILYRVSNLSVDVEQACLKAGIKYEVVKGLRFVDRKIIRDAMAYLSLSVRPRDDLSFHRVVNVPKRNLGDVAVNSIVEYAAANKCSLSDAVLLMSRDPSKLKTTTRDGIQVLGRILRTTQEAEGDLVSKVKLVLQTAGLMSIGPSVSVDELGNLKKLIGVAEAYQGENAGASVVDFLDHLSLQSEQEDPKNKGAGRIKLLTIHASKGLEFDVVFVIGFDDGILPHKNALDSMDPKDVESERRLLYVAVTRASKLLVLTSVASRKTYGRAIPTIASRFLRDVPVAYYARLKTP